MDKRDTHIFVRMSEEEKSKASEFAASKGIEGGISGLVRMALEYFYEEDPKPVVRFVSRKKVIAPRVSLN